MERLTRGIEHENNKYYMVDESKVQQEEDGYAGEAISKLAKFENMWDDLTAKQLVLAKELEQLRAEDKTRSVKFKQILANKMMDQAILIFFKSYDL